MVVALSPYKHGADYADVLLPVSPFSETSGTFVSSEGRVQSFNGSVKPLAETRPAWKVLRVLGNLLGLAGFDYETSEAIRNEVLGSNAISGIDLTSRLNNVADLPLQAAATSAQAYENGFERVADVPIYSSDAIVRRAHALQQTADAKAPKAWLPAALARKLGVADGAQVRVKQGQGVAILAAAIDSTLPENVVRVAAAHATTAGLGPMFGTLSVEKA
jgi:NADH-quinone oxidoreductase subunit G